MNRFVSWMRAHRALTALGVFLVVSAAVSVAASLSSSNARTSSHSSGFGVTGLGGGASRMFASSAGITEDSFVGKSVRTSPSPVPPFEPRAGESAAGIDQKIIKTGSVTAVFADIDGAIASLTAHAANVGGFIGHSSVTENRKGIRSGRVTMRVPVDRFESSLAYVRELSDFVRNESVDGQDVTEQYTDIQARLKNARAQEKAYLAILARANTVEDILKVQRELGNIRGQIESLEGRLKYLENRISFSTISVTLEEDAAVQIPTKKFKPFSAAKHAVTALVNAFQSIIVSIIWIVILGLGLAIPAAFIVWVIYRLVRRYRRRR